MTTEELKEKIEFETREGPCGSAVITGGLVLSHDITIDRRYSIDSKAIEHAKEIIREKIARTVYGDQRRELYEAMDEFMQYAHPAHGDYDDFDKARDRLMKAARYQPHSTDEKKINPL